MKKRQHSLSTRKQMSLKARGRRNPFFGRRHSAAWKLKASNRRKGKRNPMYGHKHSAAAIRKIRAAIKRRLGG